MTAALQEGHVFGTASCADGIFLAVPFHTAQDVARELETAVDGKIVVDKTNAKHGAAREEVAEALAVAIAVNAGAALVFSARVMDAFSVKQS